MKWSSRCVVRTSSLLILMAAIGLVVVGLITNSDGNTSFSLAFLAFTILMITLLLVMLLVSLQHLELIIQVLDIMHNHQTQVIVMKLL